MMKQWQDLKRNNPEFEPKLGHLWKQFNQMEFEGRAELVSWRKVEAKRSLVYYDESSRVLFINDRHPDFSPRPAIQAMAEALQRAYDDDRGRPWEHLTEGEFRAKKAGVLAAALLSAKESAPPDRELLESCGGNGPFQLTLKQAYEKARRLRKAYAEDLRLDLVSSERRLAQCLEGSGACQERDRLEADLRSRRMDSELRRNFKKIKKEFEKGSPLSLQTTLKYN